jgi:hypothetical protein
MFLIKFLEGGSGPILRAGIPFICGLIIVRPNIKIRKIFIIIALIIGLSTSYIGTFTKLQNENTPMGIFSITNFSKESLNVENQNNILKQIYARAGFIDFSVELIARSNEYSRIINIERYLQAIIDGLTPGFDIFNTPFSSNSLRAVYQENFPYNPSREFVDTNYHSDQFNAFTEYYILFGYIFGLIFVVFTTWIFSLTLHLFSTCNGFLGYFSSACLINLYWVWLRSFGMDLYIADSLRAYFTYAIFYFIFYVFFLALYKLKFNITKQI